MSALLGLLFIVAMCYGVLGWLIDRYDSMKSRRRKRRAELQTQRVPSTNSLRWKRRKR